MQLIWLALQTDYSFLLRFLRFLTSAPLGFLPSTNLVDCVGNCYTSLIFSFFYFSYFSSPWNLKKLFFYSVSSVLFCVLFCYIIFFSNVFSFYLSFPITLFCLLLPYVLLLFTLFSFYYLSSFRVLYLIPIFHLLYSSFCFL